MYEAFFFGPSERQLFAVHHTATPVSNGVLTLICPPLFAELNRTHPFIRKLGDSLGKRGQHILRMDYSGTGDSYGDLDDASISAWVQDIEMAVEKGQSISGCNRVRILGIRAGALLAAKAASNLGDFERLVLWDPVPNGPDYLESLVGEQLAVLEQHPFLDHAERRQLTKHYDMYRLPAEMTGELTEIGDSTYSVLPKDRLRIVSTSGRTSDVFAGLPTNEIDFDCGWKSNTGGLISSQSLLEGLTRCLS